jgi:hypothetical protein
VLAHRSTSRTPRRCSNYRECAFNR